MKRINLLALVLLVFMAFSCQRPDDSGKQDPKTTTTDSKINFGKAITRDFLGTIINKDNTPISGATITIKDKTATTDKNGVFIIKGANVNERFAYVQAKKEGFIDASRSVVPTTGTNNITIMMLDATPTATVKSGETSTVKTDDGASVTLSGNYVKEDGTSYSGDVNVTLHFLNPTDENMNAQMPGMLYAEDASGEERMLQTFGMLAVELKGTGGETLNLADNTTAKITMPLDASIAANAPSSIPLWYFDEDKGYWTEEGEAALVGNTYVGEVTHFSFWNCDIPAEAVTLCVNVKHTNGNAIAHATVTITSTTYGTRSGWTNSNGEACGLIPKNESLTLNVYNNECENQAIHTTTVGPFTEDSSINITVDNDILISETVIGTFNNCDDIPVTNGYVVLNYGNQSFTAPVTDGNFSISMLRCSDNNTFILEGFDYDTQQTTGKINYTFTTPNTSIGTLKSCDAVTEFIEYTLDGEHYVIYSDIKTSFKGGYLSISANSEHLCYLYASLNGLTDPKYLGEYGMLCEGNIGFSLVECLDIDQCNSPDMTFNLTTIGDVGEYIDFNFNGTYFDYEGNSYTLSGTYHVIRD